MPSSDPADRALIASIAGHASWAQTRDRTARTANGRAAFNGTFEKQVDPDGSMDPHTRAKAAENARREYFTRLSRRAAQARKKAAAATAEAQEADQELAKAQAAQEAGDTAAVAQ